MSLDTSCRVHCLRDGNKDAACLMMQSLFSCPQFHHHRKTFFIFWVACVASVPEQTKRTKFGPREGVFHFRAARKVGGRAKRWKEGGGGGERRERLPANPLILKNPFAHERGSWLVRCGHLDWQVYQVRVNDSSNDSCVSCTMSRRKVCELVQALAKIYKTWRGWFVFDFTQKATSLSE